MSAAAGSSTGADHEELLSAKANTAIPASTQHLTSTYSQFLIHAHAGVTISSSPLSSSTTATAELQQGDKGKCVVNAGVDPIEMGTLLLLESPLLYTPYDFDATHPCMELELVYGENSEATTGVPATLHALRLMYAVVRMCAQPTPVRQLFEQLHAPSFTPTTTTSSSTTATSSSSSTFLPLRTRSIIASLTHLDLEKLNAYIRSLATSTPAECQVATINLLTQYILLYDTNAVQVAEDEEQQLQAGSAVYACFSRFNHDCDPNCFHSSTVHDNLSTTPSTTSSTSSARATTTNNTRQPLRAVYATRRIQPNTELTISYLSQAAGEILYSTQYRRKILMLERLFFCRCTRCDSPDLARTFACPDATCKGLVTLQPKAVQEAQKATKQEQLADAVVLPVDVDTRASELNFSCSENLCTHIWDEPTKASYVKMEQQVIRSYFQLDSTISQSDEPLVPINSLIRLASHNGHLSESGHWVLYELQKMKRDFFIQVGAQKAEILHMKLKKGESIPLEEREEDGKQEQAEATRLLEKELSYVRRVWGSKQSLPWPCTIFDARFSCAKLPSSPQLVLGEARYTEAIVIEQLADAIRSLHSEHIEYFPFVLYLYAYAFKAFKTCGGTLHLMTEGVKRKYADLYKSLQQPKCANSQCSNPSTQTSDQEQKGSEDDTTKKVSELALDATASSSTPAAATLLCSNCKLARYCSRNCQEKHWKEEGHKQRCKIAAASEFTILPKLE